MNKITEEVTQLFVFSQFSRSPSASFMFRELFLNTGLPSYQLSRTFIVQQLNWSLQLAESCSILSNSFKCTAGGHFSSCIYGQNLKIFSIEKF